MAVIKSAKALMDRLGWLEGQRKGAEHTIQEISDLFMPYRGDITTKTSPGDKKRPLFDSFGVMQADRFVNFLNGSLYPSSADWVRIRARGIITFNHEVEVALDDTALRIMDALAASNFYVASQTDTRDWGVLGNSTLYAAHDDESAPGPGEFGGLLFDPIPWSRVWWVFSHIGRPLILAREAEMPALDAKHHFRKPGDRIPGELARIAREEPYLNVKIIHFVQRDPQGKKGGIQKPWSSHWVMREDPEVLMRKGGFDVNPYISARMMIMDGEQYGRGRGHIARPVMKGSNEITRQEMIALGKEMNPPFMSEEDEIAQLDLTPGGQVVVRPPKEVQPGYLRSGTDFSLIEAVREGMHKDVSEAFLGDILGEPETQTRSAEAERSRTQRALAGMASTSQTVIHEKLGPLMENVIDIMMKKGALPELEQLLRENPDLEIEPEFSSPFFTAQKAQSLNRIDAFLERRLQRFERTGDPAAFEDLDNDQLREVEKFLGDVPAKIFKAQSEIDQVRDARGDQAADQKLMEILGQRAGQANTQVQLRPKGGSRAAGPGLTGV